MVVCEHNDHLSVSRILMNTKTEQMDYGLSVATLPVLHHNFTDKLVEIAESTSDFVYDECDNDEGRETCMRTKSKKLIKTKIEKQTNLTNLTSQQSWQPGKMARMSLFNLAAKYHQRRQCRILPKLSYFSLPQGQYKVCKVGLDMILQTRSPMHIFPSIFPIRFRRELKFYLSFFQVDSLSKLSLSWKLRKSVLLTRKCKELVHVLSGFPF